MLAFRIEADKVVEVAPFSGQRESWTTRNEMGNFEFAEKVAREATALTGRAHVATETPSCWPRFDVVEAPKVGDAVSYSFNGDTYPDGFVVKVSDSLRVARTDTGSVYYRRGKTGTWVKAGGTWALVHGHRNERNPCF